MTNDERMALGLVVLCLALFAVSLVMVGETGKLVAALNSITFAALTISNTRNLQTFRMNRRTRGLVRRREEMSR